MALTPIQRRFIARYVIDFNGTGAARDVGVPEGNAAQTAYRWLMNEEVMAAIEQRIQDQLDIAELNIQWVLKQWKQIAEANPAELIWGEVECCRHCYGVEHLYQWTEIEFREALRFAGLHVCTVKCKQPCNFILPPDGAGGFGFDFTKPPVAECPHCRGKGVPRVRIADTRHLKGSARRLYAGIEQDKDGRIKVKMRDQDGALENISKYFGMLIDKKEISGPNGAPIPFSLEGVDLEDLTTEQLVELIQKRGHEPAPASMQPNA